MCEEVNAICDGYLYDTYMLYRYACMHAWWFGKCRDACVACIDVHECVMPVWHVALC